MTDKTIHIIGAGIGGLTLALGLLQGGRKVRLYEQASELGEVGAGLSISPNASKGLGYLGLLDFMDEHSNRPLKNYVFHGETNEELVCIDRETDLDRFKGEYFQIHRADFHAELVRRVAAFDPNAISLNCTLIDVVETADGYKLIFDGRESVQAEVVIGADGLKSVLRDKAFESGDPEFTNLMAWRGLVDADKVPAKFTDYVSRVWVGPARTFVTYPIRDKALVNIVAFAQAKHWTEEGWMVRAEINELIEAFDGYTEDVQALIGALPSDNLFRWGLFSRDPLTSLTKDNIGLIGDAAHPMLPWFGQGASSSIEDSVVLARCFLTYTDEAEALNRYNDIRHERVSFLQAESNAGTARMQSFDPYVLRDAPRRDEDALGIFKFDPANVQL